MKNSLYGYFIGKRLAFPVMEWFVRNNWEKYGFKKVTMVKGFFFFKFSSTEGVDSMLREGPWMILGVPIFLTNGRLHVDEKPLKKVDYRVNSDSDEEVEPVKNETANFLASKGVGSGPKSLWEQWRDTTVDAEYDPYM
ncbi:zinc knuckle CX2CX4HX4C containing protein [Tanacetum coccineum]